MFFRVQMLYIMIFYIRYHMIRLVSIYTKLYSVEWDGGTGLFVLGGTIVLLFLSHPPTPLDNSRKICFSYCYERKS